MQPRLSLEQAAAHREADVLAFHARRVAAFQVRAEGEQHAAVLQRRHSRVGLADVWHLESQWQPECVECNSCMRDVLSPELP